MRSRCPTLYEAMTWPVDNCHTGIDRIRRGDSNSYMSTFRFRRFDVRSPVVAWSLLAICIGLLSLLAVDAKLVAQFLATFAVAVVTAVVAVVRIGRRRALALAKKTVRD